MNGKTVVLSGGVGGAKLVLGLSYVLEGDALIVACNTGDDFDHLGLRVCPDIDSVLYALSNLSDQQRGWGRKDESWAFMSAVEHLQGPTWFKLGDGDLATHVMRTDWLRQGMTLTEATSELAARWRIKTYVVPMSDELVRTIVQTEVGELEFQDYFVGQQCAPTVSGFRFDGIEKALPQVDIMNALNAGPDAVIIAPSNPYVSIDPILNLVGMHDVLKASRAPIVAVSPIIGGQAIKGPVAKMMTELGHDVSALGIARHYQGLIDGFIIDECDADLSADIQSLGIEPKVLPAIMTDLESRISLAQATLLFASELKL